VLDPPSVNDITKMLRENLAQMQSVHSQNKQRLLKIQTELRESHENIEKIDKEFKETSEQFTYFQEMKEYVLDLVDCLQEKVTIISKILIEARQNTLKYFISNLCILPTDGCCERFRQFLRLRKSLKKHKLI
jgi:tRNA A37 threonylcarbamoyladenosine dehydratase